MFAPLLIQPLAMAPATITWSPKVALVMILCNVIAIAIGKAMFGGLSHGAMLGTLSLGHLLGMGAILGLASRGVV
jgi:photosystem I subunit 10